MKPEAQDAHDEDGIGMIEIVVAMFVLALLALSFLPVITQGLVASAKNSQIATATQLMSTELEIARSAGATCSALEGFEDNDPVDAEVNGRTYSIERTLVDDCDDSIPSTVLIEVDVTDASTGSSLATAQTRVLVGGA